MSQHEDYTADEMDAIWVAYQTQDEATCPYCGSVLELKLERDPAESGGGDPLISVDCPGCGRHGTNDPAERNDSEQDPI